MLEITLVHQVKVIYTCLHKGNVVTLNCLHHPGPDVSIKNWRGDNNTGGFQYDLRSSGLVPKRPKAWRVPFLLDPNYNDDTYTVSHLCHDNNCYNWDHHVLETLATNKAKNGCPGGNHCHHVHRCLRPGPYFNT